MRPVDVLVLAPHPDDEAIGCGGALALHAARGERIAAVFITSGELGLKSVPATEARRIREAEALQAAVVLGIAQTQFLRAPDWQTSTAIDALVPRITAALRTCEPGTVYFPHPGDGHPDHAAVWPMLRQALAHAAIPDPRLLAYEVWTPMSHCDEYLDVTSVMRRKLAALRCHRSQVAGFRYDIAVKGLNRYRAVFGCAGQFAEAFQRLTTSAE